MRKRRQGRSRFPEAYGTGIAIDAISPCPCDTAAPPSHVIYRARQVLVLPRRELIAAQRRGAAGNEQLPSIR